MADAPKDRDALVECMARAMANNSGVGDIDDARAALTALEAAGLPIDAMLDVMSGKAAVVPERANKAMVDAAYAAHEAYEAAPDDGGRAWCGLSSAYAAMLAASPYTPSKE